MLGGYRIERNPQRECVQRITTTGSCHFWWTDAPEASCFVDTCRSVTARLLLALIDIDFAGRSRIASTHAKRTIIPFFADSTIPARIWRAEPSIITSLTTHPRWTVAGVVSRSQLGALSSVQARRRSTRIQIFLAEQSREPRMTQTFKVSSTDIRTGSSVPARLRSANSQRNQDRRSITAKLHVGKSSQTCHRTSSVHVQRNWDLRQLDVVHAAHVTSLDVLKA